MDIQQENVKTELNTRILPVVPLRGKVLFPHTLLNFDVGRPQSTSAIRIASDGDRTVFISAQKNAFIDAPLKKDIFETGVIAKIKQVLTMSNGNMKVSVESVARARIKEFTDEKNYFSAVVEDAPYLYNGTENEIEASFRVAKNAFYEYALFDKRITKEMISTISGAENPNDFVDNAMSVVAMKEKTVQRILEIDDTIERLTAFSKLFTDELEINKIEKQINSKVKSSIDKSQKEYYLREQLKAIHEELGDADDKNNLIEKIRAKHLPENIEKKALEEAERLDKINPSSPDYSVILNYLDWILELPFNEFTEDTKTILDAEKVLNEDHFGLDKVKQRIIEYLAVNKLTNRIKGPILCFVGPAGVGKTSVATSIARALNRKFVRMSLGGVKDEAEIRGHRKTYVGAMPGRIIYGLKNAGSSNPVFLLDEIDKLSSDIHGDPASALLEVLDPEQNSSFRDRYLEVPYDLSKVMFITTANSVDTIPYPLLDRMEIIELTGYTEEEKFEIAKRYLVPKQIENNGLTPSKIDFSDDAIKEIVSGYTMEAGVRNLEKQIGSVVRKVALKVAENSRVRKTTVKAKDIVNYLGARKHVKELALDYDYVGAATGLAWTSLGGVTLTIEVSLMKGKGDILLTGKLGDVMKESARTAISYIRSNAIKYGIDESRFNETDIHIHVPEGATPKDGPSAGITLATAILSAFTGRSVKKSVAMTGEITLRGNVLAIGGLKEKSLAAIRLNIDTIIIPKANEKDLTEFPKEILDKARFITVSKIDEVFDVAINKEKV